MWRRSTWRTIILKIARPAKELKGFAKVLLQPEETKHASINLDARAFVYYDPAAKEWHITPGTFGILVGRSSEEIVLKGSVPVTASKAKRNQLSATA